MFSSALFIGRFGGLTQYDDRVYHCQQGMKFSLATAEMLDELMTSANDRIIGFFGGKMRKYILIGIGGFWGAILRFMIRSAKIEDYPGQIPFDTLMINLSGCLLLALLLTLFIKVFEMSPNIRLGLSTGFLGAFTTFCTVCKEIIILLRGGYYLSAVLYAAGSLILGMLATVLGYLLAEFIIRRKARRHHAGSIISRHRRNVRQSVALSDRQNDRTKV